MRLHMALLREGDTAWPAQEASHHKRHRPGRELPSSLHRATARRVWGHRAGRPGRPRGWVAAGSSCPQLQRGLCTLGARSWAFWKGLPQAAAACCFSPSPTPSRPCSARSAFLPLMGGRRAGKAEKSRAPLLKIDPDAGSGDHIMRQTPVCPARQWEPPPALTGTMTSDL